MQTKYNRANYAVLYTSKLNVSKRRQNRERPSHPRLIGLWEELEPNGGLCRIFDRAIDQERVAIRQA